jgi:hypothetical protein
MSLTMSQGSDDDLTSLSWLQNLSILPRLVSTDEDPGVTTGPSQSVVGTSDPVDPNNARTKVSAQKTKTIVLTRLATSNPSTSQTMTALKGRGFPADPNSVKNGAKASFSLKKTSSKAQINLQSDLCQTDVENVTSSQQSVSKKKLLVHQKTNMHKLAEYHNQMLKNTDYVNDADEKPPYSYAALICLAMKATKRKMTLSQIYKWIRENFAFYRSEDRSWQVINRFSIGWGIILVNEES